MTTLEINYNHYNYDIIFKDGRSEEDEWIAERTGKKPLEEWSLDALFYFEQKYRDDLKIIFTGISQDCDYFEDVLKQNISKLNIDITFVRKDITQIDSIKKMKTLYSEMKAASCPFKELRENKSIEENFNKALDDEFEIAVVATMSAGKSTLINAMLGTELLPARNEATTATLARIHHDDDATHFIGEAFDNEGNCIFHCDSLTVAEMEKMNDDNISEIEITGNIVGITSKNLKLVLTDTPGTNNSQNDNHRAHTYNLIKNSTYKPMVLYVLNATQLKTNDDNTLLSEIAEAMKEGGRQANDRFIFVMNKADEFDPEKGESVEGAVNDVRIYLKKHGIDNPRIYPCSALLAKNVRKYRQNKLTSKEQKYFNSDVEDSIETDELHFSEMAPVSSTVKKFITEKLEDARRRLDNTEQALIYSGIPSVEASISEYLEKYAIPMKVREALISFSEILKNLKLEAAEKTALEGNEKKLNETKIALEKVSEIMKNGQKGAALKTKIDNLSSKRDVETATSKLDVKIVEFVEKMKKDLVGLAPKKDARAKLKKLMENLKDFEIKFNVDVQNIIETCISVQSKAYIDEYNKYVSKLIGEAFQHNVDAGAVLGSLATMQLNSVDVLDYEEEREEVIGSHQEKRTKLETRTRTKTGIRNKSGVGAKISRFFGGIFGTDWGTESYTYEESYPVEVEYTVEVKDKGMVCYIDLGRMVKEKFAPMLEQFNVDTKKLALEGAVKEEKALKELFKQSFDVLDQKIKAKISEQKSILDDKKKFEAMIEESKKKLAWLNQFNNKLAEVLNG